MAQAVDVGAAVERVLGAARRRQVDDEVERARQPRPGSRARARSASIGSTPGAGRSDAPAQTEHGVALGGRAARRAPLPRSRSRRSDSEHARTPLPGAPDAEGILAAMRPLIGISPCLDERGRWHPDTRVRVPRDDVRARVLARRRRDARSCCRSRTTSARSSQRLDGLLIPGGDDFAPPRAYPPRDPLRARFRPASSPSTRPCSPPRSRAGCPCSGSATACSCSRLQGGGKLIYDIPTDLPRAGPHRLPERDGRHGLARRARVAARAPARRGRRAREQPAPPGRRRGRARAAGLRARRTTA